MVCRLIDFALVVLELLMFKVCGIINISKIEFFNFRERLKKELKLSSLFLIDNNCSLWNHCSQFLAQPLMKFFVCNFYSSHIIFRWFKPDGFKKSLFHNRSTFRLAMGKKIKHSENVNNKYYKTSSNKYFFLLYFSGHFFIFWAAGSAVTEEFRGWLVHT